MLSVAAFNALLKTLEEPPPHVTFIFATTEVHKIPVTILSRCQRYDFKLVPTQRLVAHLEGILKKENLPVERGALNLLAREAGGSVRDALSLTDQVIAYVGQETISEARVAEVLGVADRGLLVELIGAVAGGNPQAALEAVNSAADRGVDVGHLARTFLGLLRDAALVLELKDPGALVDLSADEIAGLRAALGSATRAHLVALFDRFSRCCEEMKESPAPRLVLEIALLDMASTEPLLLLSELLERVADLEKRLKAGGSAPPPAGGSPRPQRTTVTPPPPTVNAAAPPPAPPVKTAPAPTPAATRKAPDNPMGEWETVIGALEQRNVMLAGVFSHARLLDWTERGLALGFAQGSLQATLAADPDNLKKLKDFLAERYGSLDVQVKALAHMPEPTSAGARASEPAAATLAEVENERRKAERDRRESEARQHPATKAAMDTFGAAIKEIKVDG
jgi:DNA polymerase-3 subunit gamma/tau